MDLVSLANRGVKVGELLCALRKKAVRNALTAMEV